MCELAPNRLKDSRVDQSKKEGNYMDGEKRWQDMNADEQAKRITELEHRIDALEAKIKAGETQETAKGLLIDTGAIG
jgi:polyhydroxyalkanoate synthesis regulator phasin